MQHWHITFKTSDNKKKIKNSLFEQDEGRDRHGSKTFTELG